MALDRLCGLQVEIVVVVGHFFQPLAHVLHGDGHLLTLGAQGLGQLHAAAAGFFGAPLFALRQKRRRAVTGLLHFLQKFRIFFVIFLF